MATSAWGQDWPVWSPASAGLNPIWLDSAEAAINRGDFGEVHSLLLLKDGALVYEKYFHGWTADSLHMMQSATKSVVATLFGLAVRQGLVPGVEAAVLPFYLDKSIEHIDEVKKSMRVEDLLTQRTGLQWKEGPWNDENDWRRILQTEGDWYQQILSHPMREMPGTLFSYSNAAPLLTTGIIQKAAGLHIDDFARRYLFEPLGIEQYRFWEGNGGPENNGCAMLFLRPRDMAKIGQLHLQKGKWEGRQLLTEEWVAAATAPQVPNAEENTLFEYDYGYFWWVHPCPKNEDLQAPEVYLARGAGGQTILVWPAQKMVVVTTAWNLRRPVKPEEIFYRYIIKTTL